MQVDMHEAKSQLAKLARLAWEGEEIIIAKAGEPYLRLEPYRPPRGRRTLGTLSGQIRIAPDFDETPQGVIDAFHDSTLLPGNDDS